MVQYERIALLLLQSTEHLENLIIFQFSGAAHRRKRSENSSKIFVKRVVVGASEFGGGLNYVSASDGNHVPRLKTCALILDQSIKLN